jgi:hypothetical protein
MDVRRLVFEVGDRVTGSGELVADADGVRVDMARFFPLGTPGGSRPRSRESVRLIGADAVLTCILTFGRVWLLFHGVVIGQQGGLR